MSKAILAFDLGRKRTGVAFLNRRGIISLIPVVHHDHFESRWPKVLNDLLDQYQPTHLLFGVPYQPNGQSSLQTEWVNQMITNTLALTTLPILTVNEVLTSVEAHERMRELGIPEKKQKDWLDSIAAQILLESYVNQQKHSN